MKSAGHMAIMKDKRLSNISDTRKTSMSQKPRNTTENMEDCLNRDLKKAKDAER